MRGVSKVIAAFVASAAILAGCGGGGGGGTTPSAMNAPASNVARNTVNLPPASARKSYGTTQLTLKLPTVYTGKNAQAIKAQAPKTASAKLRAITTMTGRTPNFVDPSSGNLIDIFVDGSLLYNLDGQTPNDSITVQPTADGTQAIAVPLFSNQNNDVVVVEWDSSGPAGNDMLAVGETWVGNFSPGSATNTAVTLLLNLFGPGILDMYNQSDGELMNGQTYYGLGASGENSCSQGIGGASPESQIGIWEADGLQNFVTVSGYGGTSLPSLVASPDSPGSTKAGQTNIPGIYTVNWDTNCDGVTVTASATNPAYAINDVSNYYGPTVNGSSYTYGYIDCYEGYGSCPGGPYQGLWDIYWYYAEPYNPTAYLFPQSTMESVDISASPAP